MTPEVPHAPQSMPRWIQAIWLVALIAAPVVLWMLPADYFDEGQSMCPSVVFFDTECPGCGSTRAVQHLHHFELADALYFHQLAPLIYLVLAGLWTVWTYRTAARLGLLGETTRARVESGLRESAERRLARKTAKKRG